jgi:hypothetical protein
MATSETPNRTPAAVASSSASRRFAMPLRVEIRTSPAPSARMAPSTAMSAAREERCGPSALAVRPMIANPSDVEAPGEERDDPPDHEPSRAEQIGSAACPEAIDRAR